MEGGKSRRQVVVEGRGGKKVKNALAELAELRKSGGKRANTFELKEEEAVYDEVDDEEYARIVQKRREEGGALTNFPTCVPILPNSRRVMKYDAFLKIKYQSKQVYKLNFADLYRWLCGRRGWYGLY